MQDDKSKVELPSGKTTGNTTFRMLPLLFISFLTTLNWTICIPLFTPLIIRNYDGILPICSSIGFRAEIYGILLSSFFIVQIIGASIIGNLSDHFGRKKLLLFCVGVNLISSFVWNYAITERLLTFMFLGQILDGLVGGSRSVVYSSVADLSDESSKVRNFGLIAMVTGLAVIIGPFIGSRLIDPSNGPWCGYTSPFRLISLFCVINLLQIWFLMNETTPKKETREDIFQNLAKIPLVLRDPLKRVLLLVVLFEGIAFYSFTQTFQVFIDERLNVDERTVGNIYVFIGCCMVFAQGVIVPALSRVLKSYQVLSFCLLVNSLSLLILAIISNVCHLYAILPVYMFSRALDATNLNALVSHLGKKDEQGTVMGINASINSLAPAVTGIVSGFFESLSTKLPDIMAAISCFIAWAIFILFFYKSAGTLFSDDRENRHPDRRKETV
ncbi:MAG: MFS transporter [Vulcanimicrobiota bacterium]